MYFLSITSSQTGKSVFGQLLHPEPVVSLRVLCPPSSFDPTADKCLVRTLNQYNYEW